jgi:integrase
LKTLESVIPVSMGLYARHVDTFVDTDRQGGTKGGTDMARTPRASKLETRTARLKLAIAKRPYWAQIGAGVSIGYRRNQGPGTWSVRVAKAGGGHWSEVFAAADDYADANGATVMDYWQAADKARTIGQSARHGGNSGKLGTVGEALDAYETALRRRGADLGNARRVRMYLPLALAVKAVATLTFADFKAWHAAVAELTPAAINRTNSGFRAALTQAATEDERVANARVWKHALAALPGAAEARNVVLAEAEVRAVIAAAYEQGPEFGLLIEVAATTGARVSQIGRLQVADLQADRADPRLLMPASAKGNSSSKKAERRPVPIPPGLAARLLATVQGRAGEAPLLLKASGDRWHKSNHQGPFTLAVTRAGLDPKTVTLYALRHTSITRQLLAGVPITVVARLHDTSGKQIERNYAHRIADFSDTIARRALLDLSEPAGANVVPLAR